MNADRFAIHQHWLKRLNASAMQRRRAVEQHGMIFHHFFQHFPDFRCFALHHFLRIFNRCRKSFFLKLMKHERLEQFQRHFFRQAALMQFQLRANHDDRPSRIIHALAEQILAETPLFAFEHIAQRFQRTILRTAQHAPAAAIVKQRVHRFLQHALFVADNHFWRFQFLQAVQTIIPVNHAAIQII